MNMYTTAPVIAMLHNQKLNRWHPIFFLESPLPGPYSPEKPVRHKSKGHHTEGFDTREEAVASLLGLQTAISQSFSDPELCIEQDFPWDGEDTPAMNIMFVKTEKGLVPV